MQYLEYSPRTHAAQSSDPLGGPLDPPFYVCVFAQEWAPYILGALEVLAQDEYWLAGAAPARVDDLFLGLSLTSLAPTGDQKDGRWRAAGANLSISGTPPGTAISVFAVGPNSKVYMVGVEDLAGASRGLNAQVVGIDSGGQDGSVLVPNCIAWRDNNALVNDADITYREKGASSDTELTGAAPHLVLPGKTLRNFTIKRTSGGFACLIDIRGPDEGL